MATGSSSSGAPRPGFSFSGPSTGGGVAGESECSGGVSSVWLEAYEDPLAGLKAYSQHLCVADLNGGVVARACLCVCLSLHLYLFVHVNPSVHRCMSVPACTYIYIYVCVCVCVCVCVHFLLSVSLCMSVRVRVCVFVCLCWVHEVIDGCMRKGLVWPK